MNKNNPYKSFPEFVLRTPLYPFSFYKNLTSDSTISDETFKDLFKDSEIKEAIFLATPVLFNELQKWINGELVDLKKIEKIKFSLLKYISRMSSRCTPFGLFAGCAIGQFDTETKIILDKTPHNSRHTRLDMNYLVALSQDLAKIENIKNQILFFPNTSLYKSGNQLRYVEYEYVNGVRQHHIVAVEDSIYLEKVIKASSEGLLMSQIVHLLVDEENALEEVTDFVEDLIASQVLISELEPSVSGPEFLDHIKGVLSKLKNTQEQLDIINYVENKLTEIDKHIGNESNEYIDISHRLQELGTHFDPKYLFQTDVILKPKSNLLSDSVINSVKKGISLFNQITLPPKESLLSSFKDAFYERFEESEVSLSKALDVEIGVGYKQNQDAFDINPLIDDILLPSKGKSNAIQEIKWSKVYSVYQKRIAEAYLKNDYCVTLSDKDFEGFEKNWADLPNTMSTMIEIVVINGKEKILINQAGASSAANLLGRFCHGDENLKRYTQNIADLERDMDDSKILAEINHLPESRIGNILMRPILREYEIPYLAKSVLENDKQLNIEDLYVSVKNNTKIHLRSGKHNKEVIPRLTNSHNYSNNSLPIYHFLCDMQTQEKRKYIGFELGPFANEYDFIPRIEYHDLILSEAMWNLKKSDVQPLLLLENNDSELINAVKLFRENKKIPKNIMLVDGDNELLVNLENLISTKMFLNTIKNRAYFKIKEFLFDEPGIAKSHDEKEYYANQIILSFYNSQKLKND